MRVRYTNGAGFVGRHTTAAPVDHGHQVPPSWLQALQGWPCPSSPPDGLRRPLARSRAPPGRHYTTQAHQTYLFEYPRESKMTAIPIPTPTSVITELNTAVATYPETNVVLEIVEVEFPYDALNVDEEGSFRVRVTNNGPLNLTDVTLKIKGLNGALVKSGGAADLEYRDEFIKGTIEKVAGDGGSELTTGSKMNFRAPSEPSEDGESKNLIKVTLEDWNADLDRILNLHTDPLGTVKATFAAVVVDS
jgi:hypothetical protein